MGELGARRAGVAEGLEALAVEAKALSRTRQWDALPGLIDDDVLNRFVLVGTHAQIGNRLLERYGDTVTHAEFSIAVDDAHDRDTLADLVKSLQATDVAAARRAVEGLAGGVAPALPCVR